MKSDARVRYTRKVIRETFISLLEKKPISRITVTEICAAAQINRATFYKHYLDVYDLREKIEDEISEEFSRSLDDIEENGLYETLVAILTRFQQNFREYYVIFGEAEHHAPSMKLIAQCYQKFSDKIPYPDDIERDETYQKMFYSYISAGSTGVIGCWCYHKLEKSPEEVAAIIERLIHATMKGAKRS